jgi:cytochrome P450 family 714 subfamily C
MLSLGAWLWPWAAGAGWMCAAAAAAWVAWTFIVTPLRLRRYYQAQGIAGTPFVPLVGDLPTLIRLRASGTEYFHTFGAAAVAEYGPVSYMFLGPDFRLRVHVPELVRAVLVTHGAAFSKPALMRRIMGPLLGNGLVLSEGAYWHRHRRMLTPAFHHSYVKGMTSLMTSAAAAAVQRWCDAAAAPGANGKARVDFHTEMSSVRCCRCSGWPCGPQAGAGELVDLPARPLVHRGP